MSVTDCDCLLRLVWSSNRLASEGLMATGVYIQIPVAIRPETVPAVGYYMLALLSFK
jgi:hypothetical protein